MREHATLTHLASLNRYEDVQVLQESSGAGIRLRYLLVPLHPIDRIEFRGSLGLAEDQIRPIVTERFGVAPAAARRGRRRSAPCVLQRARIPAARVIPRIEETHAPDRATLAFEIQSGPRVTIGRLDIDEIAAADRRVPPGNIAVRVGDPYDGPQIVQAQERYAASLRGMGFYEARGPHRDVRCERDGDRACHRRPCPLVTVEFAGDPLPEADRERLVPVRTEGSADEDLLEDATLAIEDYLRARGYRDAMAEHSRTERDGMLTSPFTVDRECGLWSKASRSPATVWFRRPISRSSCRSRAGSRSSRRGESRCDRRSRSVPVARFHARGRRNSVWEAPRSEGGGPDRRVMLDFTVTEGPRTLVSSVAFVGNAVLTGAELNELMTTQPGRPYSESDGRRSRSH